MVLMIIIGFVEVVNKLRRSCECLYVTLFFQIHLTAKNPSRLSENVPYMKVSCFYRLRTKRIGIEQYLRFEENSKRRWQPLDFERGLIRTLPPARFELAF